MHTIKNKALLLFALVSLVLFSSIATAFAAETLAVFDPKNGAEKTYINFDNGEGGFDVPAVPKAPEGKFFIGWAQQAVGAKFASVAFRRSDCGEWVDVDAAGGQLNYFAQYASLRTAKRFPNINFGYLSENSEGYFASWTDEGVDDVEANDLYKIELTKGEKVFFQLNSPGRDKDFELYNSKFEYIDDGTYTIPEKETFANCGDQKIEYTAAESGTYYIVVSASWYDEMGSYMMLVSDKMQEFPKLTIDWISAGKVVKTTNADAGEKIVAPKVTRKGYTFVGWFRDLSFTKILNDEDLMPVAHTSFFAKWTSNDAYIKAFKKSNGRFTQKVTKTNYINRLKISKKKPSVTVKPVKSNSKSTVYMRTAGNKWAKVNSMKVKVAKGKTKTLYVKCISQTGSKYAKTYKILVTRGK